MPEVTWIDWLNAIKNEPSIWDPRLSENRKVSAKAWLRISNRFTGQPNEVVAQKIKYRNLTNRIRYHAQKAVERNKTTSGEILTYLMGRANYFRVDSVYTDIQWLLSAVATKEARRASCNNVRSVEPQAFQQNQTTNLFLDRNPIQLALIPDGLATASQQLLPVRLGIWLGMKVKNFTIFYPTTLLQPSGLSDAKANLAFDRINCLGKLVEGSAQYNHFIACANEPQQEIVITGPAPPGSILELRSHFARGLKDLSAADIHTFVTDYIKEFTCRYPSIVDSFSPREILWLNGESYRRELVRLFYPH